MTKREPYIGADGEVRDLDDAFFAKARRGRPPMLPTERKVRVNLMIDPDLARELDQLGNKSAFVNDAIRKALAGG
jgi:hypothetical protein